MRQKPFYYLFLTCYLILMVISFPFQILYFKDLGLKHFFELTNYVTPQLVAVIFSSLLAAYYAWTVDKRLNLTVAFIGLFVITNSLFFISKDQTILKTFVGSLVYISPFIFMLVPEYQEALQNRTRHWWRSAKRVSKKLPVFMEIELDKTHTKIVSAQTINISKTGALLLVNPSEFKDISKIKDLNSFMNELKATDSSLKIKVSNKRLNTVPSNEPSTAPDADFQSEWNPETQNENDSFEGHFEVIRFKKVKESDNYQMAINFREIDSKNRRKLYSEILNY